MSSTVIETCTSWESNSSVQSILLDQLTILSLNHVGDVHDLHARLDETLCVLPSLSMNLSSTSQLLVVRLKELFFRAKLSTTNSVHVVVAIVLLDLTDWEVAIRELL